MGDDRSGLQIPLHQKDSSPQVIENAFKYHSDSSRSVSTFHKKKIEARNDQNRSRSELRAFREVGICSKLNSSHEIIL